MENPYKTINIQALCAGEALIDLVSNPSGELTPCLGGSVYNLARALALQGVSTAYLNPLSKDLYGQRLRQGLQTAHVVVLESEAAMASTSLAIVNLDLQGKANYAFYREGIADRQTDATRLNALSQNMEHAIVCTGCLALGPDDAATYLPWLIEQKRLGKKIVIDVNARATVMKDEEAYKANIHNALQHADIIKVSDDDLFFLNLSAQELLTKTEAQMVVLTLGSQGACLLTRQGTCLTSKEGRALQVVDTVGAGDCFLGAFLAYLLKHNWAGCLEPLQLQAALDHAVRSASINVERQGCQPATWEESLALTLQARS